MATELCRRRGRLSVGITATAGLHGAGGFGKTTLAEMVWANRRVQRRFKGRIYRITLGLDVRSRAAIAQKVVEATRFITGDTNIWDDPELAGEHLGRLLADRPESLLILDDVWSAEQLAPFLFGGTHCRRLITTRLPELLPAGALHVKVDQMSTLQARRVLTFDLPGGLPQRTLSGLLRATGRWPLLLRLANRLIVRRIATGDDPAYAGAAVLEKLRHEGPAGLDPAGTVDLNDPRARQTAVRAAVEAGAHLLPAGGFDRFTELGVFAEDEAIPVSLIIALWSETATLTEHQSRDLCAALSGLSLLTLDPSGGGRVYLHDVIRDFLRRKLGEEALHRLHQALVDVAVADIPAAGRRPDGGTGPGHAWWQMADGYLADHLISHLLSAGRTAEAEALAVDLRWIEWRLDQRDATASVADLAQIPSPTAQQAAADLARCAHLLTPTSPAHARAAILRSRLAGYDTWHRAATTWRSPYPALYNRWPLPDYPDASQRRTLAGHIGGVHAVAVSPGGTWLATGSGDGKVRIWDVTTGRTTRTLTGDTSGVVAMAVSPDGTWLLTGSEEGKVRVWDVTTGQTTRTLLQRAGVHAVAISPDGTWFAVCSNGLVLIRDVASGQITRTFTDHASSVVAVAVSPDGTWLATGSSAGEVRIWDVSTGRPTRTLSGHSGPIKAVAISPDGTWLATGGTRAVGSEYGEVRIWDVSTGRPTRTLSGHSSPIKAVAISPDGTWLATGSEDGKVRIWDPELQTGLQNRSNDSTIDATSVVVSPDGTWLVTCSGHEEVRIWDAATGQTTRMFTGHTGGVHAVAVSPDGTWLATGSEDRKTRIWDMATGQITRTLVGPIGAVWVIVVSPDGTWLATGSEDGEVRIRDMATGQTIRALTHHVRGVVAVAVSPDGTWLATVSGDGEIRIWDVASGQITRTLVGPIGAVRVVTVSPDGTWLATGSSTGEVQIWDVASGQTTRTLTGHTSSVRAVAVSPYGTWLATGSSDGEVCIWESGSGTPVATMRADEGLFACCFLPDARGLVFAGSYGLYGYDFDPCDGRPQSC
ncbi:NB-ARC domain-containing protein (plasmid) [Streptomyces sp. NBC_01450]|uniref:NB-ARC domain-containing protein n=1 Tax=Streptomyces sp. NBC_01450 TaxID=2903871 RepID=UPI002E314949|nr:NB-ARC domain-containing protein [Streptomyces sp. NBC_01450]